MKRDVAQSRTDQQQTAPDFSSVTLLMPMAFSKVDLITAVLLTKHFCLELIFIELAHIVK